VSYTTGGVKKQTERLPEKTISRKFDRDQELHGHTLIRDQLGAEIETEQKFSTLTPEDIDAIIEVFRLLDAWDQRRKAAQEKAEVEFFEKTSS
jgi:hypothetical protein